MEKYLIGICSLNEGNKIHRVLSKFNDYQTYDVLLIDDGSTDGSLEQIQGQTPPIFKIVNPQTRGAGHGIRQIIQFAVQKNYQGIFLVAGNDKDRPEDIEKLKTALEEGYDLVQGSRFLPGGYFQNMPYYRRIATRLHPWLFSLITRRLITDSTNGFRGLSRKLLTSEKINLNQKWLDQYELEPYLYYKAIQLEFKVKEVPVTKIYPPKSEGYTKMKPISGWWSILRPLFYLGLGIRK